METEIAIYYFDSMINSEIAIVECYFPKISQHFIVGKLENYCICFYVKYYVIKQVIYLRNSCITISLRESTYYTIHNLFFFSVKCFIMQFQFRVNFVENQFIFAYYLRNYESRKLNKPKLCAFLLDSIKPNYFH